MDKNYTITSAKSGTLVLSHLVEAFLQGCFELRDQGYTLREGEVFSSLSGYKAYFDKPVESEVNVTPDPEPAKVFVQGEIDMTVGVDSGEPALVFLKLDEDAIKSFGKDREKLEEYGLTFGIDLKKNKSFKNMLIDLRNHVGG